MFTTSHFLWMGITVLVISITSFLLAMVLMLLYHMPFLLKTVAGTMSGLPVSGD